MATEHSSPELKKALSLSGLTINAMALIAPGAFLWFTYQIQASQVDPSGLSNAPDIWMGVLLATISSFLTAASYAWLARRYPHAGSGSSYYFAQRALLDQRSSNETARNDKFVVGYAREQNMKSTIKQVLLRLFITLFIIAFIFSVCGLIYYKNDPRLLYIGVAVLLVSGFSAIIIGN